MPNRSWFYASEGQQQGPFRKPNSATSSPGARCAPDTLVWTEGMAGWQKADEIPGLSRRRFGRRRPCRVRAARMARRAAVTAADRCRSISRSSNSPGAASCSSDRFVLRYPGAVGVGLVPEMDRLLRAGAGPAQSQLHRQRDDDRPLVFRLHRSGDLDWSDRHPAAEQSAVPRSDRSVLAPSLKWLVANLASNGQPLGLQLHRLALGLSSARPCWLRISVITIIGWAWVYAAQMRWICRNIEGTRREIVFNGTGLEFLWRCS